MSTRVEILNAGVNRNRIRVRHVIVTRTADGKLSVVEPDGAVEDLVAAPGQRATLHAGESIYYGGGGRCILIEELPAE